MRHIDSVPFNKKSFVSFAFENRIIFEKFQSDSGQSTDPEIWRYTSQHWSWFELQQLRWNS